MLRGVHDGAGKAAGRLSGAGMLMEAKTCEPNRS